MNKYRCLRDRRLGALLLSSLLVLAAGCGRAGTVSGKVYYKNQPMTGGTVQFFPEGKGGEFSSKINEDGSYSISKVPAGPVKIAVTSPFTNPLANMPKMGRGVAEKGMKEASKMMKKSTEGGDAGSNPYETKKGGITIPPTYGNPETSNLKLDVTGGNQPHDIKID